MKVAINITREPLAGITSTNLSLLDCLHESDTSFVGIELNGYRQFQSAIAYRHLSPEWFTHHVVSICDLPINKIIKKSKNLADVEKHFAPIIKIAREILKKEKPEVLLVNGTYYIPWILSIAAKKEKIPVVLWYAGVLSKEVEYMTPHFQKLFQEMERSIVRRASRIIFPSHTCKDVVMSSVLHTKVVQEGIVIPNPISDAFTRANHIEQSVERTMAFVGRYTQIKNLEAFCDLHKRLLKRGWKHQATIVSNIYHKKDLKKIPPSINVVPSMSATDIKTFYSSQGLIVSPSHFETFGNVPIEAVCLGIPALVHKNMGCSGVLTDSGLERMVVDFNNLRATEDRVIELCGQHVLPRQINNVRKKVDIKYVANKIVSVLQSCRVQ